MSVGILAIIGHQLTKKTLLHLPEMLEKWAIANNDKISAKRDVNYNMTEAILETIWLDWENDSVDY